MTKDEDTKEVLSKEGVEFLNSLSEKEIEVLRKSIEFQSTVMTVSRALKWCILFGTGALIAFWQIIDHIDRIRRFFMGKM